MCGLHALPFGLIWASTELTGAPTGPRSGHYRKGAPAESCDFCALCDVTSHGIYRLYGSVGVFFGGYVCQACLRLSLQVGLVSDWFIPSTLLA